MENITLMSLATNLANCCWFNRGCISHNYRDISKKIIRITKTILDTFLSTDFVHYDLCIIIVNYTNCVSKTYTLCIYLCKDIVYVDKNIHKKCGMRK